MKKFYLATIFTVLFLQLFAQNKHRSSNHVITQSTSDDLPQNVIDDFAKAVNYAWNYADNTDAFKGALIPGLRRRGIYNEFDIVRTIQDVGKNKGSRDIVLSALMDYTGVARLNQILLNMDIPANSARILTSYAYSIQKNNDEQPTKEIPGVGEGVGETENAQYIVTAQKAHFYNVTNQGGYKRKAYLVEGETITGLKKINGYIYCEFTNSLTKITSKGWIMRSDLDQFTDLHDTTKTNVTTPDFKALIKLDGKDIQRLNGVNINGGNFFKIPIIKTELKRILGTDYNNFLGAFLSEALVGDIVVRNNVLFLKASRPHAGLSFILFIDLAKQQIFLDSNHNALFGGDGADKAYGDIPPSENIDNFARKWLINNQAFMDEKEVQTLNKILSNDLY